MVDMTKCPDIWQNPENKLPVQQVEFDKSTVKLVTLSIGGIGLFIMSIVFVLGDRGPTIVKAIYHGNKKSKYVLLLTMKPFLFHLIL